MIHSVNKVYGRLVISETGDCLKVKLFYAKKYVYLQILEAKKEIYGTFYRIPADKVPEGLISAITAKKEYLWTQWIKAWKQNRIQFQLTES